MITIGIRSEILQQILDGRKTVEGRLRTGKFITVRKGDQISLREDTWENDRIVRSVPDRAVVRVTATEFFDNFADMLGALPLETVLPDCESVDEALQTYRGFYTEAQEKDHGVVAISFELFVDR